MLAPSPKAQTVEAYGRQIYQECIEGSAIAPSLFHECIKIRQDVEIGPGGDISTPIHDALGWHYTRFGQKAHESLFAALFAQETGEEWQAKLSKPRLKDGKELKYETPIRSGSRAYLPPVNRETRQAIAARYECEIPPPSESFWDWLEQHPEIEIILTEGGKKGLCLLSHGYVAIALTGVNGGYRIQIGGVPLPAPELIPDLARFASPGRVFRFAFDQDTKPTARRRVAGAIGKTARLLSDRGCNILVTRWQSDDGKGIDDLIVNLGIEAWEKAYREAKSSTHYYIQDRQQNRLKRYKPTLTVNVPDLSAAIDAATFPDTGIIAIASDTGTGKTKLLAAVANDRFVKLGHRRSLERNGAQRLGGHFLNDVDYAHDRPLDANEGRFLSPAEAVRKTLCFDSLLRVTVSDVAGGDLILDEADQGIRHLLTSATCRDGKRPLLLKRFEELLKAAKRVFLLSADLGDRELDYICQLRGEMPSTILRNKYKRQRGKCRFIHASDDSVIVAELLRKAASGSCLFVVSDSLARALALAKLLKPIVAEDAIFEFNSKTSGSDRAQAFAANPDQFLQANPQIQVAIVTPSGFTGLSIEADRFDAAFGLYYGGSTVTDDAMQSLERVRAAIPRTVWAAKYGKAYSQAGQFTNPIELKGALKKRTDTTAALLRSELTPEKADSIARYEWADNPHLHAWAACESDRNLSMQHFRDCLQVRLELCGYELEVVEGEADKATRDLLKQAIAEIAADEAIDIAAAANLTADEAKSLEAKDYLEPDEAIALSKWQLANWYAMLGQDIQPDDVLFDRKGRTRTELYRLEHILFPELAVMHDTRKIEQFIPFDAPATVWDLAHSVQERQVYELIGFRAFLESACQGSEWSKDTESLQAIALKCRQFAADIKTVLHLTINDRMTDVQIIGELLRRIGIKTISRRHRVPGKRLYLYKLDPIHLERLKAILQRRHEKRVCAHFESRPTLLAMLFIERVGRTDPAPETGDSTVETANPPLPTRRE